ncbi:hypothetical protein PAMA_017928 [Pampus argenteus]
MKKILGGVFSFARHWLSRDTVSPFTQEKSKRKGGRPSSPENFDCPMIWQEHGPMSERPPSPLNVNCPMIWQEHEPACERPLSHGDTNPSTTQKEQRQRSESPSPSEDDMPTIYLEDSTIDTSESIMEMILHEFREAAQKLPPLRESPHSPSVQDVDRERQEGEEKESLNPEVQRRRMRIRSLVLEWGRRKEVEGSMIIPLAWAQKKEEEKTKKRQEQEESDSEMEARIISQCVSACSLTSENKVIESMNEVLGGVIFFTRLQSSGDMVSPFTQEKSKQKAPRNLSPENLDCPMIWHEHGPAGERPLSRGDTNPSTTQKVQRQRSESPSPSQGDMPAEMEERRRGKIPLPWVWVNEEREIQERKGQETEEVEEQSETKREKKERVRQEKDQRKREKKEVKEKLKEERKRQKKTEKETQKREKMEMKGVKKEDKKVESQEREEQKEEETQRRAPTGDLLSRLDTWLNNYMRKNVTHHINRTYERQWLTQLNISGNTVQQVELNTKREMYTRCKLLRLLRTLEYEKAKAEEWQRLKTERKEKSKNGGPEENESNSKISCKPKKSAWTRFDNVSMKKILGGVFSFARHWLSRDTVSPFTQEKSKRKGGRPSSPENFDCPMIWQEHGPMSERPPSPLNVNCPMIWQEHEPACERPLSHGDTNPSTTQKEQRQRSESPSPSEDDMPTIYLEDSTMDTSESIMEMILHEFREAAQKLPPLRESPHSPSVQDVDRERQEGEEKESLNPEVQRRRMRIRSLVLEWGRRKEVEGSMIIPLAWAQKKEEEKTKKRQEQEESDSEMEARIISQCVSACSLTSENKVIESMNEVLGGVIFFTRLQSSGDMVSPFTQEKSKQKAPRNLSPENLDCPMIWHEHGPAGERPLSRGDTNPSTTQKVQRQRSESPSPSQGDMPAEMEERRRGKIPLPWVWVNEEREIQERKGQETEEVEEQSETKREKKERVRQEKDQRKREKKEVKEKLKEERKRQKKTEKETQKREKMEMKGVKKEDKKVESQEREEQKEEETQRRAPTGDLLSRLDTWLNNYMRKNVTHHINRTYERQWLTQLNISGNTVQQVELNTKREMYTRCKLLRLLRTLEYEKAKAEEWQRLKTERKEKSKNGGPEENESNSKISCKPKKSAWTRFDNVSMKKILGGVFSFARHWLSRDTVSPFTQEKSKRKGGRPSSPENFDCPMIWQEHGPMSERPPSPLNVNCPMIWQEHEPACERPLSHGDTNPSTTQKEQRQRSESPSPSEDDMPTIYLEDSTMDTSESIMEMILDEFREAAQKLPPLRESPHSPSIQDVDRERQEGEEEESLNPEVQRRRMRIRSLVLEWGRRKEVEGSMIIPLAWAQKKEEEKTKKRQEQEESDSEMEARIISQCVSACSLTSENKVIESMNEVLGGVIFFTRLQSSGDMVSPFTQEKSKQKAPRNLSPENLDCPMIWHEHGPAGERPLSRGDTNPSTTQKVQRQRSESPSPSQGDMPAEMEERRRGKIPLPWVWVNEEREIQERKGQETEEVEEQSETKREKKERVRQEKDQRKREKKEVKEKLKEERKRQKKTEKETQKREKMEMKGVKKEDKKVESQEREEQKEEETQRRAPTGDLLSRLDTWLNNYMRKNVTHHINRTYERQWLTQLNISGNTVQQVELNTKREMYTRCKLLRLLRTLEYEKAKAEEWQRLKTERKEKSKNGRPEENENNSKISCKPKKSAWTRSTDLLRGLLLSSGVSSTAHARPLTPSLLPGCLWASLSTLRASGQPD